MGRPKPLESGEYPSSCRRLGWLAAALPRATLAVLAGAGHVPFVSHTDAFVAALERFVDER